MYIVLVRTIYDTVQDSVLHPILIVEYEYMYRIIPYADNEWVNAKQ